MGILGVYLVGPLVAKRKNAIVQVYSLKEARNA